MSLRTLIKTIPTEREVPKAGARYPESVCIQFIIFLICVKRQKYSSENKTLKVAMLSMVEFVKGNRIN